jgi:hypothetical protein
MATMNGGERGAQDRARLSVLVMALAVTAPLGVTSVACGGGASSGSGSKMETGARAKGIEHEACPPGGAKVEGLDTNADGKEDIRRAYDGSGRELCRIADLNHDGKADLYEFFDTSGTIRRREYCYDDTGVVNAVEYYEGGKLVRREYDTSGQHSIDTWDWFDPNIAPDPKTGRPPHPVRRERDTTGDGRVDQWWAWDGNKITIAVDHDGDGKPDPETAVVLGGDNSGAPPPPAASAAPPAASAAAADGGAYANCDYNAVTCANPSPAAAADGGKK